MGNWKVILGVVLGTGALVTLMAWGLSRVSSTGSQIKTVDFQKLVEGARLFKENGETKVTVVDFSDMECPACKRAMQFIKEVENLPGVKIVFRHFPLGIHADSEKAARMVEAARIMGKGWEMVDLLYEKQGEWSGNLTDTKVQEYAGKLSLNVEAFMTLLDTEEVSKGVAGDQALGDSLQIYGTPTFYVNGELVASDFLVSRVKELLK